MSRIERRKWEQEQSNQKGLFGMFDDVIMTAYRLTNAEFDHLCEVMNDEELDLFTTEKPTYSEKRQMITLLNKYLYDNFPRA
jgi:hypothetical protein